MAVALVVAVVVAAAAVVVVVVVEEQWSFGYSSSCLYRNWDPFPAYSA